MRLRPALRQRAICLYVKEVLVTVVLPFGMKIMIFVSKITSTDYDHV